MKYKKKLIEVALPLDAINKAASKEKSIRQGHPSTLHLWWARRPLAACRATIFASIVDDPSSHPEKFKTIESQNSERLRLFGIIERLVQWESSTDTDVLSEAMAEIAKYCDPKEVGILDPFSGGASISLEAQRLGLFAQGTDLNPVPVIIGKALCEMPFRFSGFGPVNPSRSQLDMNSEMSNLGLAEDVKYYGEQLREIVRKKIGSLYPEIEVPKHIGKGKAKIIAWLWARTVASPNPALKGTHVPLVRSFIVSKKKNKKQWVHVDIAKDKKSYSFRMESSGEPRSGTVNRKGATCILSGSPITFEHIRTEGRAGRLGFKLMAIVIEYKGSRFYIDPTEEHEKIALSTKAKNSPDTMLPEKALGFRVQAYGMAKHADLFTQRQLVCLTTFADTISEVIENLKSDIRVFQKASKADFSPDFAEEYAKAIALYLGIAVSRSANTHCSLAVWSSGRDQSVNVFSRHALPMNWDFPEVNPFGEAAGDMIETISSIYKVITRLRPSAPVHIGLANATEIKTEVKKSIVLTDPPYYDNIGYADLSDFFYIWMRRSLGKYFPDIFSTVLTPKSDELIATPFRFDGDYDKAKSFFEKNMELFFTRAFSLQSPEFPFSLFYAFKQSEGVDDEEGFDEEAGEDSSQISTGWETMLSALLNAGFCVVGTWPMRTERPTGVKVQTNSLATSIVLTCRPREQKAKTITKRDFQALLRQELPKPIEALRASNIAAVDLTQAAIGPGVAIFSKHSAVLESDDTRMSIRSALLIINQVVDEILSSVDSELDPETRWCITWFEKFGFGEGDFGAANQLAQARNVSVDRLARIGLVKSQQSKVKLIERNALDDDWTPEKGHTPAWLALQYLIRYFEDQGGEMEAGRLLRELGPVGSACRDLAYRCFAICERNGWAVEGMPFNSIATSWGEIQKCAVNAEFSPKQETFDV